MEELLIVTALAMVLDVATGLAGAVKAGDVQSGKMREGLWHKAGFVGLVAMAAILEYLVTHIPITGVEIPYIVDLCAALASLPLVLASCLWIIVTEAASIIENLCVLSPAIADSPIGRIFAEHGGDVHE